MAQERTPVGEVREAAVGAEPPGLLQRNQPGQEHGRHRHAEVTLLDLEAPHLLRRGRIGRAPEERRKPADVADLVALRLAVEAAYHHLVDEMLA